MVVVSSGPGLLKRTMLGSMTPQQPESELMSIVTKGHVEDQALVNHLRPCQCLRTTPCPGPCLSGCLVLPAGTNGLWPMAMSGAVVLWKPFSGVFSMASVATEGYKDARSLASHLIPC